MAAKKYLVVEAIFHNDEQLQPGTELTLDEALAAFHGDKLQEVTEPEAKPEKATK